MKPIFSIIIPCYNVGAFVDQAIQSCLNQVGVCEDEFEIIAINDGSTDNTAEQLSKYVGLSNVIVINQTNSGLSVTRNNGIDKVSGEYVLFLDGDDWYSEDALSILKQYVGRADLVIFPMEYYYSDTNIKCLSFGLREEYMYSPNELLKETIGKSKFQTCPAPTKCYKMSILKEHNQKFIEGILHEDGPYFLETLHNISSVMYIERYLYHYRQLRPGSITTVKRTWRNAEGVFKGQKRVYDIYGNSNKDINFYFISSSVMQLIQPYSSEDDACKVVKYMSAKIFKKFMWQSLLNSRFELKTIVYAIITIISPKIARVIYNRLKKR